MKNLSFDSIHAALVFVFIFDKLKTDSLTKKSAEYYLQTEGINGNLTEKCFEFSTNAYKYKQMFAHSIVNLKIIDIITLD